MIRRSALFTALLAFALARPDVGAIERATGLPAEVYAEHGP